MARTKAERLEELCRRLTSAPPAHDASSAKALLDRTLNEVEDELSGVPYDPDAWFSDGRLYPPQEDSVRAVPGRPDVRRYRTRMHNVFVGENGAIRIEKVSDGSVVLDKAGADGKSLLRGSSS